MRFVHLISQFYSSSKIWCMRK